MEEFNQKQKQNEGRREAEKEKEKKEIETEAARPPVSLTPETVPVPVVVLERMDADSTPGGSRSSSPARGRFWRKRTSSEQELAPQREGESPKRTRGRPPTTGEYVGLARAKAELNAAKERELELRAEEELKEELRLQGQRALYLTQSPSPQPQAQATPAASARSLSAEQLSGQIEAAVTMVQTIATKSSNLKGQYVRDLKNACTSILENVRVLVTRTESEEVAQLQAELVAVRAEMRAMQQRAEAAPPPMSRDEIGFLVDARLAGIADRLLPETRIRPPLQADRRNAARSAGGPEPAAQPLPPSPPKPDGQKEKGTSGEENNNKKKKKKAKGKTAAAKEAEAARQARQSPPSTSTSAPPSASAPLPQSRTWSEVAARPKAPKPAPAQPQAASNAATAASSAGKRRKRGGRRSRKLRTPQTAAITLTLQPGTAVTYGQVMAKAERSIDLKALGIEGLRLRTAVTGGRILEVAGADRAQKADRLAAKLREVLEEVRVARPVRCVEMRISGLSDSATEETVAASLAAEGGCSADQIKVGVIKRPPGRQGTAWLRCPVEAARKLTDGRRIVVGWSVVRLTTLEPRPARCYRCLETGHVGAKCAATTDRSALCFRCGQAGHKLATCTAEPSCPVCSAAGAAAGHRLGSAECKAASRSRGRAPPKSKAAGGAKSTLSPNQPSNEEEMDTAQS